MPIDSPIPLDQTIAFRKIKNDVAHSIALSNDSSCLMEYNSYINGIMG